MGKYGMLDGNSMTLQKATFCFNELDGKWCPERSFDFSVWFPCRLFCVCRLRMYSEQYKSEGIAAAPLKYLKTGDAKYYRLKDVEPRHIMTGNPVEQVNSVPGLRLSCKECTNAKRKRSLCVCSKHYLPIRCFLVFHCFCVYICLCAGQLRVIVCGPPWFQDYVRGELLVLQSRCLAHFGADWAWSGRGICHRCHGYNYSHPGTCSNTTQILLTPRANHSSNKQHQEC